MAGEGSEYAPVPASLVAATRNVYATPLVRPAMVRDVSADCASGATTHLLSAQYSTV